MGQAHADAYRRAALLYRDLPRVPVLHTLAETSEELAEAAAEPVRLCACHCGLAHHGQ